MSWCEDDFDAAVPEFEMHIGFQCPIGQRERCSAEEDPGLFPIAAGEVRDSIIEFRYLREELPQCAG